MSILAYQLDPNFSGQVAAIQFDNPRWRATRKLIDRVGIALYVQEKHPLGVRRLSFAALESAKSLVHLFCPSCGKLFSELEDGSLCPLCSTSWRKMDVPDPDTFAKRLNDLADERYWKQTPWTHLPYKLPDMDPLTQRMKLTSVYEPGRWRFAA